MFLRTFGASGCFVSGTPFALLLGAVFFAGFRTLLVVGLPMSYLSALAGVTVGALGGAAGSAAALGAFGSGFAVAFARAILLFSFASELRASKEVPAGIVWYLCGCVSAASVSALFTAPAGGGGGGG